MITSDYEQSHNVLSVSYQLIGLGLWQKFEAAIQLMESIAQSDQGLRVAQIAVSYKLISEYTYITADQ